MKTKILTGILAIVLVLGMVACSSGGGGGGSPAPKPNTDPKTIVITGIKGYDFTRGDLGIVTEGTSLADVLALKGLVAGADSQNSDIKITSDSITIPLYKVIVRIVGQETGLLMYIGFILLELIMKLLIHVKS